MTFGAAIKHLLFLCTIKGSFEAVFLCPNSPHFRHLNLPQINFFTFSVSFPLAFFPLPHSRYPLILFFLLCPTGLLHSGAPTSTAISTLGQKVWSPSRSTLLAFTFLNFYIEKQSSMKCSIPISELLCYN
jgi:hypothetical protein